LLTEDVSSGAPNEVVPDSWNAIPGARGCTPQACSFRDASSFLTSLGVNAIYGISTQDSAYQAEAWKRLSLPYDLLSDEKLEWAKAMGLPTFEWEGKRVLKRCNLVIKDGVVVKVWYPVFPPDASAKMVVEWLERPENGKVTA
jgi:peroxiredoxin